MSPSLGRLGAIGRESFAVGLFFFEADIWASGLAEGYRYSSAH